MMPSSLMTAAGRGYSDLCASMCAVGLGARELQIWKEVDGIFTADPREVPSARLLATITLEEAAELTFFGSEVIHPLTMSQIRRGGVPMRIKNVLHPSGEGTIILPGKTLPEQSLSTSSDTPALLQDTTHFMIANGYHGNGEEQGRRRPTAVTSKVHIAVLNLEPHRNSKSSGFLRTMFEQLEHHGISVDLVTVSEKNISIAVDSSKHRDAIHEFAVEMEEAGKVKQCRHVFCV